MAWKTFNGTNAVINHHDHKFRLTQNLTYQKRNFNQSKDSTKSPSQPSFGLGGLHSVMSPNDGCEGD